MKQRIRLTESDLHKIVRNSLKRVVNETLSPYNPTTQGTSIGQEFAFMLCEKFGNDKTRFVPLIDIFLKNGQNQQMLHSIGQGFVEYLLKWVQKNHAQFYQNRINKQQVN